MHTLIKFILEKNKSGKTKIGVSRKKKKETALFTFHQQYSQLASDQNMFPYELCPAYLLLLWAEFTPCDSIKKEKKKKNQTTQDQFLCSLQILCISKRQ